jgi:S1-C subfamily serine protease
MPPGSISVRSRLAALVLALVALSVRAVAASDDASAGYEKIRPSLVKVWAFDGSGRPTQSGTGIVVDSNDHRSTVLTASHVIAGAASIRIDVSRDLHDLAARVERTGPRDLSLLTVERGGLHVAHFAPRTHAVIEGNMVAVAGYVKNDELIGIVGQEPRVLFPGTVASRPENGIYLELENVHIEEGLSGGAVFDPGTGEILGIVTSRTSDQRGGFADSGTLVVVPFLAANNIAAAGAPPGPAPAPRVAIAAPPAVTAPAVVVRPLVLPPAHPVVAVNVAPPAMRPLPVTTLSPTLALAPPPAAAGVAAVAWQAGSAAPKRFVFERNGCRIAVTIDISSLQFAIAHQALVQPHRHGALLGITLQRQAASTDACANVADTEPFEAAYDPTAMAFDGHHVTMRFVYAGDPSASDRFPSDASLDADLDGDAVTATVQFFDRDWTGSIALPLARTSLASISANW